MAVEERRRLALHRAASATWGEEAADTLVELVTPAGHDPATRADVASVLTALEGAELRLTAGFARGLREAITAQIRALVVSLLVSVVAIAGLAFGLAG